MSNTEDLSINENMSTDNLQLLEEQRYDFGVTSDVIKKSIHESKQSTDGISSARKSIGMNEEDLRFRTFSVSIASPIPENSPAILSWSDLTVKTKNATPKVLLDNITGQITGM